MSWRAALTLLAVVTSVSPMAASNVSCEPTGLVEAVNARLIATAFNDDHLQVATTVWLYANRKLLAKTKTDQHGSFMFDHFSPGRYPLIFDGFGSIHPLGTFAIFDIEVKPTFSQQGYYHFGRTRDGCLTWGMNTD